MTPLHVAASHGNIEVVQFLVSVGCQLNATDKDTRTALHIAASQAHEAVAEFLIQNGISVIAREKVIFSFYFHSRSLFAGK